jgi:ABC-type Fe3+-hydroxamate transport system substrate-binding protein
VIQPRRIISLVPSQTELLYDLGLEARVAGITKFCVHPPEWKSSKVIVGGTKNVDHDLVDSLKPDLILANKEENTKDDVELLSRKYRVWVSDVATIDDAYEMMSSIGELTGTLRDAEEIKHKIQLSFSALPAFKQKRTLYLIWKKPWMTVGIDTFIHSMMKVSGFGNVIVGTRYPKLSDEEIRSLGPEVVLLSSEPYPFKDQHVEEIQRMLPAAKVILADGEMFSWYGSRMREAAGYFSQLRLRF